MAHGWQSPQGSPDLAMVKSRLKILMDRALTTDAQ